MSDSEFGVNLIGIQEVLQRLSALEGKARRVATRKTISAGARIIKREMKRRAPRGPTGNLKRSIRQKVMVKNGGRIAWAVVTPRHEIAPHRHLVVRGTQLRAKKKAGIPGLGQITGRVKPNDFIGDTFDAKASEASEVMLNTAAQLLQAAIDGG